MIPARSSVTVGLVLLLGLAALSVGRRRSTARPVDAAAAMRIEDSSSAQPVVSLWGSEGGGPAMEDRAVVGTQSARLHGCVRGRDGRLVAAGSVTVRGSGRSPQAVGLAADGTFSVEGLEPGTWQVLVRGPDFETVSLFVEDLVAGEDREQHVLVALLQRLLEGSPLLERLVAGQRVVELRGLPRRRAHDLAHEIVRAHRAAELLDLLPLGLPLLALLAQAVHEGVVGRLIGFDPVVDPLGGVGLGSWADPGLL
jgi:hypothetical protein